MTRTEFLQQLWSRIFRPLIFFAVICFCMQFLFSVFTEKGTARFVTIALLLLTILFALAYLFGALFEKMIKQIAAKLSDNTKSKLRIFSKLINYLTLPLLVILFYKCWEKDAVLAAMIFLLFFGERIIAILKERNTTV